MKRLLCLLLALSLVSVWGCNAQKSYTVHFYNGDSCWDMVMSQGEVLKVPEVVTALTGLTVEGMYKDPAFQNPYPADTKVTGEMDVYICWVEGGATESKPGPTDIQPEETPSKPSPSVTLGLDSCQPVIEGSWGDTRQMHRDGTTNLWYLELDVPKNGKITVKDAGGEVVWGETTVASAGGYMIYLELEETADGGCALKDNIVVEKPQYYVVGTCGNGNWEKDAVSTNFMYTMYMAGDEYRLDVEFTGQDADQTGMVSFLVVYGAGGKVASEHKYGSATGDALVAVPGTHTITFEPDSGTVSLG